MKTFKELPLDQRLNPVIQQLESQDMYPLNVKQYSGGITEIWFDPHDWMNFTSELIEHRLSDYELISETCWFETKREQCDGCGKDFTFIKVFFPTVSLDEFVEVVTPEIYAEWHGGEA
jgi:hypothetical protein